MLHQVDIMPMITPGILLPQAKLLYRGNKTLDPKLNGSWNIADKGLGFINPISASLPGGFIPCGILMISPGPPPGYVEKIDALIKVMEDDSKTLGCPVRIIRNPKGEPLQ